MAVDLDLVSTVEYSAQQVRVPLDLLAEHEERRRQAGRRQRIQDEWGPARVGPVVERQGQHDRRQFTRRGYSPWRTWT